MRRTDPWEDGRIFPPDSGSDRPGAMERPWTSPGPPPNHRNSQRSSGLVVWIAVAVVGAVAMIVAGLVLLGRSGAVPAGVPVVGQDSGVAACEAIASGKAADGGPTEAPGEKMTQAEYQQVRKVFADSSDPEIREHGTKLVDLSWQTQQSPESMLLVVSQFTDAYTGLAGACASHGHAIPPLGS
jgi:hypothetical protein